mgnify:CR=1 FL=1
MKSSRYWKLVALLREIQIQGKATYTINQLRRMYNDAIKELDKEITKAFRTFQYGEDITEAEAEELINAESQRRISRELQAELERTDDPSIKAELTRRIHATAYGARISRLEAVKQNVFIYFTKLAIDEIAKTKTLYNTVVEESYYRTIHDFGYGVNMGVNFSLLPSKAIDEIVSAKWHGASFSSRVWSNTKQTAEQAQEIITRGLLSRKSYNQMANELAEVTQNSKYNATRLVRTQCNHYLNAGEFKAYEELGVEQYLYLATLDYKTCRRCQPLDGSIFNTKDKREGVNAPTIHPHCRCTTTVPVEFARRWARDPITGKGVKIPNMTYSEWVESMSEEQKAAFDKNVKMYKNRSSDKKQYERYKERLGKENVPETLELFQEKKYNGSGDHKALERSYRTIGEIEGKSQWSDTFRQKAIDAYWEFKQNGIEMSAHAVGRFLDRCEGMFTLNDIVMQAKRRFNYIQPDGRYVKFYNGIAIIYNSSGTEVVSLVMRNTIKKDWSELHD